MLLVVGAPRVTRHSLVRTGRGLMPGTLVPGGESARLSLGWNSIIKKAPHFSITAIKRKWKNQDLKTRLKDVLVKGVFKRVKDV